MPDQAVQDDSETAKKRAIRMMLTLQLAVILPAAVLVILSAWHLKPSSVTAR